MQNNQEKSGAPLVKTPFSSEEVFQKALSSSCALPVLKESLHCSLNSGFSECLRDNFDFPDPVKILPPSENPKKPLAIAQNSEHRPPLDPSYQAFNSGTASTSTIKTQREHKEKPESIKERHYHHKCKEIAGDLAKYSRQNCRSKPCVKCADNIEKNEDSKGKNVYNFEEDQSLFYKGGTKCQKAEKNSLMFNKEVLEKLSEEIGVEVVDGFVICECPLYELKERVKRMTESLEPSKKVKVEENMRRSMEKDN